MWQRVRSWRWWVWAVMAVVAAGIVAAVAVATGGDDAEHTTTGPGTSVERSTATSSTSSTSTTAPLPSTTGPATTTPPTTVRTGGVPGTTTVIARRGGGSGEIVLDWRAVAGATGYRVVRATSPGARFEIVADLNVTTGKTTAADGVTTIWSAHHRYLPSTGSLAAPDDSPWFQYVDVGPGQRCYRVIAYNAAGARHPSAVTCGSPP